MCVSGCCLHPRILPSLFPSFVIVSLHVTFPCFFGSSWCWRISLSWHMSLWQQWNFYFVEGSKKEEKLVHAPVAAVEFLCGRISISCACPFDSCEFFVMLMDLGVSFILLKLLWNFYDIDGSGCLMHTPQTAMAVSYTHLTLPTRSTV